MRLALASDDESALVDALDRRIRDLGHEVTDLGIGVHWTDVGRLVGESVVNGAADLGIVCCWTGTGVSIAANKVAGVRCALCADAATAVGARRFNDANVLALSLRLTTPALGIEILDAFVATPPDEDERPYLATLERRADQATGPRPR